MSKLLFHAIGVQDITLLQKVVDSPFVDLVALGKTNNFKQMPLHLAASLNFVEVVKFFLKLGFHKDGLSEDASTPLMIATKYSAYDVVELLIEEKADLDAVDTHSNPALFYAIDKNEAGLVELLTNDDNPNGRANVNFIHPQLGWTYLTLLASRNDHDLLDYFLQRCSPSLVNIADMKGKTPLLKAVLKGDAKAAELLIKYGANVNYQNPKDGNAPILQKAVTTKIYDYNLHDFATNPTIKALTMNGASWDVQDDKGLTAADYLEEEKTSTISYPEDEDLLLPSTNDLDKEEPSNRNANETQQLSGETEMAVD